MTEYSETQHMLVMLKMIAKGPVEYPPQVDALMRDYQKAGLIQRYRVGSTVYAEITQDGFRKLEILSATAHGKKQ